MVNQNNMDEPIIYEVVERMGYHSSKDGVFQLLLQLGSSQSTPSRLVLTRRGCFLELAVLSALLHNCVCVTGGLETHS